MFYIIIKMNSHNNQYTHLNIRFISPLLSNIHNKIYTNRAITIFNIPTINTFLKNTQEENPLCRHIFEHCSLHSLKSNIKAF